MFKNVPVNANFTEGNMAKSEDSYGVFPERGRYEIGFLSPNFKHENDKRMVFHFKTKFKVVCSVFTIFNLFRLGFFPFAVFLSSLVLENER